MKNTGSSKPTVNLGVKIFLLCLGDLQERFRYQVGFLLNGSDGKINETIPIELTLGEIKAKLSEITYFSTLDADFWNNLFYISREDPSGEFSRFLIEYISNNNSRENINFLSKNTEFLNSFLLISKDDQFYEKVFKNFYYKLQLDRSIIRFLAERGRSYYRNKILEDTRKRL